MRRTVLLLALTLAASAAAFADNWPGWRGPLGTGHSSEKNLPVQWSPTENVRWKVKLPGPGMSSPIVWGDRVFVTQALDKGGKQRSLICFDRKDGRQVWQKTIEYAEMESTYSGEPHYCSASPVTDGQRVVVSHGSAGVFCYDFQGNELWRRDLGKAEQIWGNAASPVIWQDRVFLNFGPGERTFLVAMDKKTGKDLWKIDVPNGKFGTAPTEWVGSWSTPVVAKLDGRDTLVMSWPETLKAYDALSGEEMWSCGGLGKLVYSSPLVTPEVVVAMSGFGGPFLAVRTGGKGDVTASHRLFQNTKAPQRVGSGVLVGDHVYILNATGVAECIDWKTGNTVWSERATQSSWGSMVHVDGKLYVTSQRGETVVLAAKPQFEVVARNVLNERSNASPAISNGEIFLRTYDHLWCIGKG